MKIILDLSSQLSEQAEKIAELERELQTKDQDLEQLRLQLGSHRQVSVNVGEGDNHVQTAGRPQGSRRSHGLGSRPGVTPVTVESVSRGNSASQDMRAVGKLTLERQSTALSDSDSDWEMEASVSKIHSAPARTRVKSAVTAAVSSQHKHLNISNNADTRTDSRWNFATDDNKVTLGTEQSPRGSALAGRQKRRSQLKNKQELERNMRSQRDLIGPTLAFVLPAGDPVLDTSCNNTPATTPRTADSGFHMSTTPIATFTV